jgi:hypothetical protein
MKGMGYRRAMAACLVLGVPGCPTVDLGDTPSEIGACNPAKGIDYFVSDIEPKYLRLGDPATSCARGTSCHDRNTGFSLDPSPGMDAANYQACQLKLNCGNPKASPLLTFPLAGIDGHGGGDIYQPGDPEVAIFLAWFQS